MLGSTTQRSLRLMNQGQCRTIFWITLYWQNYEELPVLEMTAKFVPLSVTGVSVNFIMALLVAHVVSQLLTRESVSSI